MSHKKWPFVSMFLVGVLGGMQLVLWIKVIRHRLVGKCRRQNPVDSIHRERRPLLLSGESDSFFFFLSLEI
jgi:hypothetical protein